MVAKSSAYLKYEFFGHIYEINQILDQSTDYFLLSRFASTPKRREFFQKLHEENLPKSDLILAEFMPILTQIRKLV